jgi:hypothetical protein
LITVARALGYQFDGLYRSPIRCAGSRVDAES